MPPSPSPGGRGDRFFSLSLRERLRGRGFSGSPPCEGGVGGSAERLPRCPGRTPLNPPFARGDVLPVSRVCARSCKTPPSEPLRGRVGVGGQLPTHRAGSFIVVAHLKNIDHRLMTRSPPAIAPDARRARRRPRRSSS